jgi:hypothetical protein
MVRPASAGSQNAVVPTREHIPSQSWKNTAWLKEVNGGLATFWKNFQGKTTC